MSEFKEFTELERLRYDTQGYLDKIKVVQKSIFFKKVAIKELKEEEIELESKFQRSLNSYYKALFYVKEGDVIKCEEDEYRFVKFANRSKDPIVNEKLKSGKWSKKSHQLHLYDWDKKERMNMGNVSL